MSHSRTLLALQLDWMGLLPAHLAVDMTHGKGPCAVQHTFLLRPAWPDGRQGAGQTN